MGEGGWEVCVCMCMCVCTLEGNPCLERQRFPIEEVHCKQRLMPVEKTKAHVCVCSCVCACAWCVCVSLKVTQASEAKIPHRRS